MSKLIYHVKYLSFTILFTLTLFLFLANSHAGDSITKITASELEAVLENNKGKVVIVDLWATWCPPCRKEIPGFINLYSKYKDKGVEIIGIAFDENGLEAVPPFIKKMASITPSILRETVLPRLMTYGHIPPVSYMVKTAKLQIRISAMYRKRNLITRLANC